jgi:hypothetical protein
MDYLSAFAVNVGLGTPSNRGLIGAAIGFAVQLFIKPSISYITIGNKSIARPFKPIAPPNSKVPPTLFPWYFWPISFAIIGGLFL